MRQGQQILTAASVGWSVAPLIKPNCRLKVDLKPKKYRLGDIVVFMKQGKLTAHRIIRLRKNPNQVEFYLKGDNNAEGDGWLPANEIVGLVETIVYPQRSVNLKNKKNQILKYGFVLYSRLNLKYPGLLKLKETYKFSVLKNLFRFLTSEGN